MKVTELSQGPWGRQTHVSIRDPSDGLILFCIVMPLLNTYYYYNDHFVGSAGARTLYISDYAKSYNIGKGIFLFSGKQSFVLTLLLTFVLSFTAADIVSSSQLVV